MGEVFKGNGEVMTQSDNIRNMTDRELLGFVSDLSFNCYRAGLQYAQGIVPDCEYGACPIGQRFTTCCISGKWGWLESEVKNEN